jgi:nucleoside-diphosphate-sugar epimerase
MKILITGHKGFVGKYFVKKYIDHEIIGVDLKDGNDCRDFFKKNLDLKIDLVIHLAAIVGGRVTIENNPLAVADDLSIDSEFIQWCLKVKPTRVVYFSSSAAYPIKLQNFKDKYKLKESDINLSDCSTPDMTYGWAKLTGEFCLQYLEEAKIKVHIFRPFSGYGTDQDLNYPFPAYIMRGKLKLDPFEIWGDGTQVRDFIHIQDIVDAVDTAINNDIIGPVNLGSGIPTTFNILQQIICQQIGYSPQIKYINTAPVGVMYRCCNPSKMLSFYKPKICLEHGINMAIKNIT